jgi:NADH-quinone oxidoreductase subunit M
LFCTPVADLAHFMTIVSVPWVPPLGMNYHLAVDGVSLTMVLVTGISAVSTVLFSWDIDQRQREFFFWLLLVVGGCYGVFLSADLFLFFAFYELVIVPKYFLIAIFGSTTQGVRRDEADSLLVLRRGCSFLPAFSSRTRLGSLDLNQLAQFHFSPQLQSWAISGVVSSDSLCLPASGRCIHGRRRATSPRPPQGPCCLPAFVMKLGAYAGLRVAMNLFPEGFHAWSKWIACPRRDRHCLRRGVALRQHDLKFVIGYRA